MTTTPEGISTADLADLLKDAPKDKDNVKEEGPFNGFTGSQVIAAAEKAMDDLYDEIGHPMVHKALALLIINNLTSWHKSTAATSFQDDQGSCLGWAEDVGKLKVSYEALRTVQITSDDFTCPEMEDEDED